MVAERVQELVEGAVFAGWGEAGGGEDAVDLPLGESGGLGDGGGGAAGAGHPQGGVFRAGVVPFGFAGGDGLADVGLPVG